MSRARHFEAALRLLAAAVLVLVAMNAAFAAYYDKHLLEPAPLLIG